MAVAKHDLTWRARLGRDIGWSMIVKLGLLMLLWAVFFSRSHQCRVDGPVTANRLALDVREGSSDGRPITSQGERCD